MTVIPAWELDAVELRRLNRDAFEHRRTEQWELICHRRGRRRPEGYVCGIPCFLRTALLQAALAHTLDRISDVSFEDALELQERVWALVPLLRPSRDPADTRPRWLKCLRHRAWSAEHPALWRKGLLGRVLGGGPDGLDVVYFRDAEMDFGVACYVLAHEFGHVLYRGEWHAEGRHGFYLRTDTWTEAAADEAAVRWGFAAEHEAFCAWCQRQQQTATAARAPSPSHAVFGKAEGAKEALAAPATAPATSVRLAPGASFAEGHPQP